ncbi:MAG: hypothetical protein AB1782_06420 [Cyanobacteriota bacterium]
MFSTINQINQNYFRDKETFNTSKVSFKGSNLQNNPGLALKVLNKDTFQKSNVQAFTGNSDPVAGSDFLAKDDYIYKLFFNTPSKVNIPGVSDKFMVYHNIYTVGDVNLLLVPKDTGCRSLYQTEQKYNEELHKSMNSLITFLKKMYPDRNIYFAEHGSGSVKGNKQDKNGRSVEIAHGHFIIAPEAKEPSLNTFITALNSKLKQCNWQNIDKKSMKYEGLIPDKDVFKAISDKLGIKFKSEPPYLLIGKVDKSSKKQEGFMILKTSESDKTPSQLIRIVMAELFYGSDSPEFWDWKKLMDCHNNGNTSQFTPRLNDIRKANEDFWERYNKTINNL